MDWQLVKKRENKRGGNEPFPQWRKISSESQQVSVLRLDLFNLFLSDLKLGGGGNSKVANLWITPNCSGW